MQDNISDGQSPEPLSLASLISESPTSFHAAAFLVEHLTSHGCTPVDLRDPLPAAPGAYVTQQDGAIAAWVVPDSRDAAEPLQFNVIAGHTDSPGLKLKPRADHEGPRKFNQLAVEPYGGLLPNTWLDRDLGIAGRIITADQTHLVRSDNICRIAQLAVHLDRSSAKELHLDLQKHMRPIWAIGRDISILDFIAEIAGLEDANEILAHDLYLFDSQPPATIGIDGEFLTAARQDNLASMYSATVAFTELLSSATAPEGIVPVLVGFDHEEIGSATATGAQGPFLEHLLTRIAANFDVTGAEFDRSMHASICLSSDVAHSIHPNYPSKHDADHRPVMGRGPVLKQNANQRYATDAVGAAQFVQACLAAGVEYQTFAGNNSVPCGSTIGPHTATRLGMRTVDVGAPILSMHSIREMSVLTDHEDMAAAMLAWWQDWA